MLALAVNLVAVGALLGLGWLSTQAGSTSDSQRDARPEPRLTWTRIGRAPAVPMAPQAALPGATRTEPDGMPAWLHAPDAISRPWTVEPDGHIQWQR